MAGEHLAELLGGKGRVIMLRYPRARPARCSASRASWTPSPGIPASRSSARTSTAARPPRRAYKASENLLAPVQGRTASSTIDGIFCPNESTTFGMLRALQDGGWPGKVKFVGFDSSDKLVEALRRGEIDGLVLQNPMHMGYLGVKTMVASTCGEARSRSASTPARRS